MNWLSINEKGAPKEDGNYVCLDAMGELHFEKYMAHWWIGYTHWIALPELPCKE